MGTIETLFNAIVSDLSLEQLTKLLEQDIFHNPVMITNSFFHVVSMSGEDFEDEIWVYAKEHQCCSVESVETFRSDRASKRLFTEGEPFIYDTNLGGTIPRILAKIKKQNKTLGYLIVFSLQPFADDDLYKSALVCEALSIVLKDTFQKSSYDYVLSELLQADPDKPFILSRDLRYMDLTYLDLFAVCNAGIPDNAKDREYIPYILSGLSRMSPHIFALEHDTGLVILLNEKNKEKVEQLICSIQPLLKKYGLKYGQSMLFTSIRYLSVYNQQAMQARKIGSLLDDKQYAYRYSDLSFYIYLSQYSKTELQAMLCYEYQILMNYDRQHDTNMIEALVTYHRCNLNMQDTADALHLHRNSLRHRLERIEFLIDLSLKDIKNLEKIIASSKIDRWICSGNYQ